MRSPLRGRKMTVGRTSLNNGMKPGAAKATCQAQSRSAKTHQIYDKSPAVAQSRPSQHIPSAHFKYLLLKNSIVGIFANSSLPVSLLLPHAQPHANVRVAAERAHGC
eukprot:5328070-Pleurochrysis_carterae.AAC.2